MVLIQDQFCSNDQTYLCVQFAKWMLSSLQPGSSDTGQSHTEHRQGHTLEMKCLYVLILFLNLKLNSNPYLTAHVIIFKMMCY